MTFTEVVRQMNGLIATETEDDKPPSFEEALLALVRREIKADEHDVEVLSIIRYADEDQCDGPWHGADTGCCHLLRLTVHYRKRRPYEYHDGKVIRYIEEEDEWSAETSLQRILACLVDGLPYQRPPESADPGSYYYSPARGAD